jgi:hypothetical protein
MIGLVYYLVHFGYIDQITTKLNHITGQDAIIPRDIMKSLEPVTFRVVKINPNGYSYMYKIPPCVLNRVILVTCTTGFNVVLDSKLLENVLNETKYKQTVCGFLYPSHEEVTMEVFTVDKIEPVLHFGQYPSRENSPTRENSPLPE